MLDMFGNKPSLKNRAQGFEHAVISKSYHAQEVEVLKQVGWIPTAEEPSDANMMCSRVSHKMEHKNDNLLTLKARIAPHGNEDSMKPEVKTDCCTCFSSEIRLLLSLSPCKKWRPPKIDVKSAFLQTSSAASDVFVIPSRESSDRPLYWLLLAAS